MINVLYVDEGGSGTNDIYRLIGLKLIQIIKLSKLVFKTKIILYLKAYVLG